MVIQWCHLKIDWFLEVKEAIPAWSTFITRMSLAILRRFQHLTAEVREWAALKACQQKMENTVAQLLVFPWPLKKKVNFHVSNTNSVWLICVLSPNLRWVTIKPTNEPKHRCHDFKTCFEVLFWTLTTRAHIMQLRFMINSKKDDSRQTPVHLSRHFMLPTVYKPS